jgi:hypothetical protein
MLIGSWLPCVPLEECKVVLVVYGARTLTEREHQKKSSREKKKDSITLPPRAPPGRAAAILVMKSR